MRNAGMSEGFASNIFAMGVWAESFHSCCSVTLMHGISIYSPLLVEFKHFSLAWPLIMGCSVTFFGVFC